MLNSVVLIGRLTRDPELRYTPAGNPVARFSLAVDRRRGAGGEKQTDFIRISCWNKTADTVAQYLQKGRLIAVEGSLRVSNITNPDGTRREFVEVVCNSFHFLDRGKDGAPSPEEENEFAGFGEVVSPPALRKREKIDEDEDDDVPF
ncbi:MAG: single-stranded DNA-binding protein [Symbiobacteriaceae bacterium]|nr:single-stranded DNA-binding protein [Symbiobacteriaceae bacterium]